MQARRFQIVVYILVMFVGGCVSLPSDFKEPGVSVVSVTPRLSNGITPEFDILLHVTNPNRSKLSIAGLSYSIHLIGNKVLDGVANDLPVIPPFGEAEIELNARVDLLGGFRLLNDLLLNPNEPVDFEFSAEIDVGTFYPTIFVRKTGVISFR